MSLSIGKHDFLKFLLTITNAITIHSQEKYLLLFLSLILDINANTF